MKPRAYFCPCVEGPVPLDHWTGGKCNDHPMPIGWLIGICKDRTSDKTHCDGNITATRLTSCPRQVLVEDFVHPRKEDADFGLVFDPRRMNSARFGQVVHADIAKHTPGGKVEMHFEKEVLDFGGGVTCAVSGTVDYFDPGTVVLVPEDYKTHSESAHRFKWQRKSASPEDRSQFGIYKELIEHKYPDKKVTHALVWHGAMTSAKHPAPPWFKVRVQPLTLREIGDLKPFGSGYPVREVIQMYSWALEQIGKIEAPRDSKLWYDAFNEILNSLAMVGEPMFGGQKCLSYCGAAQPYCYGVAGRMGLL